MEEAGHTAVVLTPCCGNDDHGNQPGAVKTLTETQGTPQAVQSTSMIATYETAATSQQISACGGGGSAAKAKTAAASQLVGLRASFREQVSLISQGGVGGVRSDDETA